SIIFLGTGGDAQVVGQQQRGSGGIMISVGENQLHIDPGPGSLIMAKACNQNIRLNTAVMVTHNHLNHCNDVNQVIHAMTHGGLDKKGVLVSNRTLVEGSDDLQPFLTHFHRSCVEKSFIMTPGKRIGINDLEIEAISAFHSDPHAVGYRIFAPSFSVCYTGDTEYHENLGRYCHADVLILNVRFPRDMKEKGHLCTEDAAKLVKEAKPKLAIITHFGTKMLAADPSYEARIIQQKSNIRTIAATDGLIINPVTFSTGTNL
ncbi:MAG: MBL fold metallo-hydrolase, partial [Nanoarchaeota archaeon]